MKTETNNFVKFYLLLIQKNLISHTFYIIQYSDNEDDEIEIHASSFVPSENNEDGELSPIETDEEWDMIEEMLNTFLDEEGEE